MPTDLLLNGALAEMVFKLENAEGLNSTGLLKQAKEGAKAIEPVSSAEVLLQREEDLIL